MQDIRKPYTRSKSSQSLNSQVEEFESRSYASSRDETTVHNIPIERSNHPRRNLSQMEMYPRKSREEISEERDEPSQPEITYRDPRTRYKRKQTSFGTWALIGSLVLLASGVGLLTYVFNSATVTIVPKHSDINDFHKALNFTQDTNDLSDIPFIIATSSVSKSKELTLSESRKVEAKASGKIVIYNNFDASPQKLIKGTRFESSEGKIYRINESITVPGKSADKPGSLGVVVYADSYGTDYNSAPTDFTIPGFKGTPRYKGFFAHSDGAVTGGASGVVSIASLPDINAAKDELALELAQEVKDNLSKIEKSGYTSMYSASEITYEDNQADVLLGASATYKVTATGYLMLADSKSLASAIAHEVRDYANEPVRLGYEDTLTYTRKDTDHVNSSTTLSILVDGKPRIIWVSDEAGIKKMVAGKSRGDFKPMMKTIDSIEGAEIGFSPLWLSSFPTDTNKIAIIESLPKR